MGRADNIEILRNALTGFPTAMLVTRAIDGSLRSRPMATAPVMFDGMLWFLISAGSEKANEIALDDSVCIAYADANAQRFVSVTGRASVVDDARKARELWAPLFNTWFPSGPDDPDVRLIRVEVIRAECWESPEGAVVQLVGFNNARKLEPPDEVRAQLS